MGIAVSGLPLEPPWFRNVYKAIAASNTKNAGTAVPNLFADPNSALNAFEPNYRGTTGGRNILRFVMPYNEHRSFELRAEAFNITNSTQFDVGTINLDISIQANFGNTPAHSATRASSTSEAVEF